ncbi:MAG: gfo/Idh/MocA family oxidoreductase [Acidobacteria bacterium]|nr:MAG: gfo/Idh/MocA family oxidoreductase [Acidobacteriota bacterium]
MTGPLEWTRRRFLGNGAAAGAALGLGLQGSRGWAQGSANDKVVVAVMGVRSRGLGMAHEFAKLQNTEVKTVCDVDSTYLAKAQDVVAAAQGFAPATEADVRRVLEDPDVDALVVAAPDHWHAPVTLMALAAGKHVYLEKPCSHNPREGELLVEAQRRHPRVVVHMGNQRRSWPGVVRCIRRLREGMIGRVYFAKGWYANNRGSIGRGQAAAVPEHLDWELWQGPAPRTTYRDNVHPYNWHWFERWGTGEALNNGTHEIDVMRWALGADYPTRVTASGGRYHFDDDWEFPDTMVASFEFEGGLACTWEGRSCNNTPVEGWGRGVMIHGTEGTVLQVGNGYTAWANDQEQTLIEQVGEEDAGIADPTNTMSPNASLDGVHVERFLAAVRGGAATPSPIDEGHKSVLLCQLANIAWKTGRALRTDPASGRVLGDDEAMSLWGREYEPGWEPVV